MTSIGTKVLAVITAKSGMRTSDVVTELGLPRDSVEDALWGLWSEGRIQIEADSTLRLVREGEKVFRHFAP